MRWSKSVRPRPPSPRLVPLRFRSTIARSQHDHRRGYHAVGVAVARELPVLAPRLAAPEDVARLVAALAAADHRDVVRWLVRHARPIMRHVPRERRYSQFLAGIAAGCTPTMWSQFPRI